MFVNINGGDISGKIVVPSSKSIAHRVLISAFLSGEKIEIDGNLNVGDIKTTLDCLKSLGLCVTEKENGIIVQATNLNQNASLNVKDSGSTFRFLLPVVAAKGLTTSFVGTKRLANRPISELLDLLQEHGISFSSSSLPFEMSGQLSGSDFEIEGSVSSQYISGLLLALPLLKNNSILHVTGGVVSEKYIDITLKVLLEFGIEVFPTSDGYSIEGGQQFEQVKKIFIEGDWSSACFFASLGAMCGSVTIGGLDKNSTQGDKIIVETLERIGANVSFKNGDLIVKKDKLKPIVFDAENYPDIVPILSVVLASADGISTIKNISRLRAKESDRVEGVLELLKAMGVKAYEHDDSITINGGIIKAFDYVSPLDHRMAMAAAVAACVAKGQSKIENAECVEKSYPEFFEHLKALGGKVDVQSV